MGFDKPTVRAEGTQARILDVLHATRTLTNQETEWNLQPMQRNDARDACKQKRSTRPIWINGTCKGASQVTATNAKPWARPIETQSKTR